MIICPVCGSEKWKARYIVGRWNIDECGVCGFAKIDPMPAPEARAGHYSEEEVVKRNIKQKSYFQKLSRTMKQFFSKLMGRNKSGIFFDRLHKYLPAGSRVLDIGCGDGSFLKMAKKDFVCAGIEISGYLASLAQKDGNIKVITGNFIFNDFAGEKYNGITMISLLEHLDDPLKALKKCFELLNENGILLLKTVNYGCLNRAIKKKRWTGFRPPDHMVYFNAGNLKAILRKTGFSKINISAWPFNDNMYCEAHR